MYMFWLHNTLGIHAPPRFKIRPGRKCSLDIIVAMHYCRKVPQGQWLTSRQLGRIKLPDSPLNNPAGFSGRVGVDPIFLVNAVIAPGVGRAADREGVTVSEAAGEEP